MTCKSVQRSLWETPLNEEVIAHLNECGECEMQRRQIRALSAGMRNLPVHRVPELATLRLQVLASHRVHGRLPSAFGQWCSRMKLAFDNLLKPLAVPAVGGIMASFLCFGVIVDKLQYRPDWSPDIPVGLFTEVTMDEPSPFGCQGEDVIVQLTVDENGKVTDYTLPRDGVSPAQMQEIGNLILYSTFIPATSFGQRVSSRILVDIHHVNVRG
ncbi:MAG TPA: hypothetical protein VEF06_02600 [Bryobacteraceae bacterium]|nr:hypothetical protein [Bryobacteraceae bacterium]